MKKVSIVLSCYNEEKCVKSFFDELVNNIPSDYNYEFLYVDDGSVDLTLNR